MHQHPKPWARLSDVRLHRGGDLLVYRLQVSLLNFVRVVGVSHDQQGAEARLFGLGLQLVLDLATLFCGQASHLFALLFTLLPQALQDS